MAIKGAYYDATTGKWRQRGTGVAPEPNDPQGVAGAAGTTNYLDYSPGQYSTVKQPTITGADPAAVQGGLLGQAAQKSSDILKTGEYGISATDQQALSDLALNRVQKRLNPIYRGLTNNAIARGVYTGGPLTSAYGTVAQNFADTVGDVESRIAIDNRQRMATERNAALSQAAQIGNRQEQLGLQGERLNLDATNAFNQAALTKQSYDDLAAMRKFQQDSQIAQGVYEVIKNIWGDDPMDKFNQQFKDLMSELTSLPDEIAAQQPAQPAVSPVVFNEGAFSNMIAPNAINFESGAIQGGQGGQGGTVASGAVNFEPGAVVGAQSGAFTGAFQGAFKGAFENALNGALTGAISEGAVKFDKGAITGVEKGAFENMFKNAFDNMIASGAITVSADNQVAEGAFKNQMDIAEGALSATGGNISAEAFRGMFENAFNNMIASGAITATGGAGGNATAQGGAGGAGGQGGNIAEGAVQNTNTAQGGAGGIGQGGNSRITGAGNGGGPSLDGVPDADRGSVGKLIEHFVKAGLTAGAALAAAYGIYKAGGRDAVDKQLGGNQDGQAGDTGDTRGEGDTIPVNPDDPLNNAPPEPDVTEAQPSENTPKNLIQQWMKDNNKNISQWAEETPEGKYLMAVLNKDPDIAIVSDGVGNITIEGLAESVESGNISQAEADRALEIIGAPPVVGPGGPEQPEQPASPDILQPLPIDISNVTRPVIIENLNKLPKNGIRSNQVDPATQFELEKAGLFGPKNEFATPEAVARAYSEGKIQADVVFNYINAHPDMSIGNDGTINVKGAGAWGKFGELLSMLAGGAAASQGGGGGAGAGGETGDLNDPWTWITFVSGPANKPTIPAITGANGGGGSSVNFNEGDGEGGAASSPAITGATPQPTEPASPTVPNESAQVPPVPEIPAVPKVTDEQITAAALQAAQDLGIGNREVLLWANEHGINTSEQWNEILSSPGGLAGFMRANGFVKPTATPPQGPAPTGPAETQPPAITGATPPAEQAPVPQPAGTIAFNPEAANVVKNVLQQWFAENPSNRNASPEQMRQALVQKGAVPMEYNWDALASNPATKGFAEQYGSLGNYLNTSWQRFGPSLPGADPATFNGLVLQYMNIGVDPRYAPTFAANYLRAAV